MLKAPQPWGSKEMNVREKKENGTKEEKETPHDASIIWEDSATSLLKVFKQGIDVPFLISLTMRFSKILINGRRPIEGKAQHRANVIVDVLVILQTLLKRTDLLHNMDWTKVDIIDYENFLQLVKTYRLRDSEILEDEQILNTLYLMVKQAFPFKGLVFLEYLMEVAYGDHREEHTTLQDMAAVCCAIISTQNATDASTPTVNVASVVKDNAAFVHALARVPDPKMQIWHYRLLTGWSRRPKVLDDLVGDAEALKFIVDHLLETHLCRYSVVIVHNISMLRSGALISKEGHLSTICEAYRQLKPGATLHRADEDQRRLLRRLLLASVRNCLWNSSEIHKDLAESDMGNIIHLVSCVEEPDLPFFMAMIMYISEGCNINRVRQVMYGNAQMLELFVRCMFQQVTACVVNMDAPKFESSLYGLITEEEARRAEQYEALVEHQDAISSAPKKQTEAYKKLLAIPGSPAARGLGKTASLYQRSRRKGLHPVSAAKGEIGSSLGGGGGGRKFSEVEERRGQQEFLYFSAVELLTFGTFAGDEHDQRDPPPEEAEPHRAEVVEALHAAFSKFPMAKFLKNLAEQVQNHKNLKVVLSDMFVHVTTKFLWHCWTQPIFKKYLDTPANLQIIAQLIPFFISWPNPDVQNMIAEVCLYGGLHRFTSVCDILIAEYREYPELSCALLTRCLISPIEETGLKPKQAIGFLRIFVCLLQERALSHTGLKRLAVGLETALVMDNPKGLCAILAQREHELLAELLEALSQFSESAAVKQCMVVALTRTVGKHYKALPELDDFILRILDMSVPLLDAEFTLYMPVLYKVASEGGRRVQGPMLTRHIHLRVARLLEQAVAGVEADQHKIEGYNDEDEEAPAVVGPKLDSRGRMQWCLAFLTALATVQVKDSSGSQEAFLEKATRDRRTYFWALAQYFLRAQSIHFDSFVCVDLLPMLVRILRQSPEPFEALAVCFLLSSVSTSPCLPPHMPDVLRISEQGAQLEPKPEREAVEASAGYGLDSWANLVMKAFPSLLSAEARASGGQAQGLEFEMEQQKPEDTTWKHLKIPQLSRIEAGIRRCFIHLLSRAAHVPKGNACLLNSHAAWHLLTSLASDPDLYGDPGACVHAKVYALAFLLQRFDDHKLMIELGLMERLLETKDQIKQEMPHRIQEPDLPDLRLPWIHCVISLVLLSGPKLFAGSKGREFEQLVAGALDFANDLQFEGRSKIQREMPGLALDLECQQSRPEALAPFSTKVAHFANLKPKFTLYLLALICSAPTLGLRQRACEFLTEMLTKGQQPHLAGAAFLKANCLESFRRILTGPLDELAASTSQAMIALASSCYDVHAHMLQILDTVLTAIGSPSSGAARVMSLSELFVGLTATRTAEVEGILEMPSVMPFLGLARSSYSARRDLVQKWLEAFGSSLYELDEVSEVFSKSTLQGLLYVSARSTLDPEEAISFRKVLSGPRAQSVETWRNSYFGPYEFLSETIIAAMIPVCELQPDLVGAMVALIHSFITHSETRLLERIWTGGHVPWLCKRLADQSRVQKAAIERMAEEVVHTGITPTQSKEELPHQMAKGWERHEDLVVAQGMVLRILSNIFDLFPAEFGAKVSKDGCIVKNWRDHVTFYCHHAGDWPMKEDKELRDSTESILELSMQLAGRLVFDVNEDMQRLLVQQGMIGVCSTMLLPTPAQQAAMRAAIGQSERSEDTSETLFLPEAKILAGAAIARLLCLPDAYRYIQDRRAAKHSVSMFSQLHHWRDAVFDEQGTVAVLQSVSLLERCASLYLAMVSGHTLDWCFDFLGLAHMDVFLPIMLRMWADHPNPILRHHGLRLFGSLCQVHCLFSSTLQAEARARQLSHAIHRTFGIWDVRELRHMLRLMVAVMCHVLFISTTNVHFAAIVERTLARKVECPQLAETLRNGAAARASSNTSKYVTRAGFLTQMLAWAEKPGDHYARTWGLWLILTLFAHEASEEKLKSQADTLDPDAVLVMEEVSLEEAQVVRRNRLLDAQEALGDTNGDRLAASAAGPAKLADGRDFGVSLVISRQVHLAFPREFAKVLSRWVDHGMHRLIQSRYQWKDSQQLGCVASAWCLIELPAFVQTAVHSIDSRVVSKCLTLPEKSLQLAALLLIAVSRLRLASLSGKPLRGVSRTLVVNAALTFGDDPVYAVRAPLTLHFVLIYRSPSFWSAPTGSKVENISGDFEIGSYGDSTGSSFLDRSFKTNHMRFGSKKTNPSPVGDEDNDGDDEVGGCMYTQTSNSQEDVVLYSWDLTSSIKVDRQVLIESLASGGEGPYDTIARWLHEPLLGLPNEHEFRCLVSFMIGQCIKPPLAAPPSLDLETAMAPRGKELVSQNAVTLPPLDSKAGRTNEEPPAQSDGAALGAPPVAECGPPPAALIDKLAQEVLKEDQRLQDLTGPKNEGPIFSTMLCHLLYALAVMVPAHPKEAAQSVTVRGAAFAQLIKVQHIVAQQIQPKVLYDPADADRAKLLLYVRATACVRSALQSIMASWFAADFGARFVISEEGGQDFLRHLGRNVSVGLWVNASRRLRIVRMNPYSVFVLFRSRSL
ncbi:unnamed protein product [Symbiodinium sp. CCMP2456]|nr:unnamed protein product [Symbiodinium sp. CCMP2456]